MLKYRSKINLIFSIFVELLEVFQSFNEHFQGFITVYTDKPDGGNCALDWDFIHANSKASDSF